MSLFSVANSDWIIRETSANLFELSTQDGKKKISNLTAKQLTSALAVISELDRYLKTGK